MTLIVGIKCADGIVLGSDGAATLGSLGQSTVRQAIEKIEVISNAALIGVSGPVGLAQYFIHELQEAWEKKEFSGKTPVEARKILERRFWPHVESEVNRANVVRQVIAPQVVIQSVVSSVLVALPVSKSPCLFQFNQQCSSEEATENLPFVAIGSGQAIADPFLAFIREIFLKDQVLKVNGGTFAALWTLRHAIRTHPGGVADPISLAQLTHDGKDWMARRLEEPDLLEHQQMIDELEGRMSGLKETLAGNRKLVGEILVEEGTITEEQLQKALEIQAGAAGR